MGGRSKIWPCVNAVATAEAWRRYIVAAIPEQVKVRTEA